MMMTADVEKFHFRLVLLGSLGTGFLFKKFETKYKPTVEDLFSQDFDLGSIVIKVDFLDTSGSMQFPAMRRLSLTTGSAFLMVYALDDENSYEVLKICMQELLEVRPDFQEVPIVFAGNKCDVPRDRRKVTKEVVSNYVYYELPRLRAKVIECSCRDNINIDNIFRAYMSLAKVTLSTAVSAGMNSRLPISGCSSLARANPTTPPATGVASSQKKQDNTPPSSTEPTSDSPSVSPSSTTPTNVSSSEQQQQQFSFTRRPNSSFKMGLSVRKSCDASIVSPRRSTFFGVGQQQSQTNSPMIVTAAAVASVVAAVATADNKQTIRQTCSSGRPSSASTPTYAQTPTHISSNVERQQQQQQQQFSADVTAEKEEFNLEMAIQSKLSINERPKPRSRSLIWRPSRTKSTRATAASNAINNGTDCRVT